MPSRFPVGLPLELAWSRRVLCAAEIIDAVTLERITQDLSIRVDGLTRPPRLNASGFHVWTEELGAQPQRFFVDASATNYADAEADPPVPPEKSIRIELAPRYSYAFPQGATALRGSLRASRFGAPRPIAGAKVRLQWSGDNGWVDAPVVVTSDDHGDFAAPLRFGPSNKPVLTNGALTARLRITRGGFTRTSDPFALPRGRVTAAPESFIWEDLHS